ncbi:TonB-dependent receptor, partial [candidate division FCPU426 bacterium]|nr:TonB-dependent receptor [candidate division FCPU426 bacterium]
MKISTRRFVIFCAALVIAWPAHLSWAEQAEVADDTMDAQEAAVPAVPGENTSILSPDTDNAPPGNDLAPAGPDVLEAIPEIPDASAPVKSRLFEKPRQTFWLEETVVTVVTATKSEANIMDIPQFVTVVDSQDIFQAQASFTPDLLSREPGLMIQKTNYGGGVPFLRGMTGKQILLLIDGVRLNNSLYRYGPHQYLNTIDPDQIDRIEVIHGPGSLFYGSDALGGVINIITKKQQDFSKPLSLNARGHVRFGSADRQGVGRLALAGNAGNLGCALGGTYKDFNDLRGGRETGLQVPTAYTEKDYDAKINYQLSDDQEIILAQQTVFQHHVPKTSEVTLGGKYKYNYEPQERSLTYAEFRAQKPLPLLETLRINLSYGRQQEGEEVVANPLAPNNETRERNGADTLGAFLHLTTAIGQSNMLSYGAEYYRDLISSSKHQYDWATGAVSKIKSAFPDHAAYGLLGCYLQDKIRLLHNLSFLAGVRYSRTTAEGNLPDPDTGDAIRLTLDTENFSGSIGTVFSLSNAISLTADVAQGFRAPNMEDFFGKVDFATEIPNPNLQSEKVLNYELGCKVGFARWHASVCAYVSDYTDLINRGTIMVEGEQKYQRQNLDRARILGAELAATYYFTQNLSAYANCAYTFGE